MPGPLGNALSNQLINLIFGAPPSTAQFTGGYQPATPNPNVSPITSDSLSPLSSGLQANPGAFNPAQMTPFSVAPAWAKRNAMMGGALSGQAAEMNERMGQTQMGAQNAWANSQGVNPLDPTLSSLGPPDMARGMAQAQAGQAGAMSSGLDSYKQWLMTQGGLPYAQQIGNAQGGGILAQLLNQRNRALGSAPYEHQLGAILDQSGIGQGQATIAQSGQQQTLSNQANQYLKEHPEFTGTGMQLGQTAEQANINKMGRDTMFAGGQTAKFDPVTGAYLGSVSTPPLVPETYSGTDARGNPTFQTFSQKVQNPPKWTPAEQPQLQPTRVPLNAGGATLLQGGVGANVARPSIPQIDPATMQAIIQMIQRGGMQNSGPQLPPLR